MFSRREKDHELYNQDSDGCCYCCHCDTGCFAGIKSVFRKIKSYRFIKPKNKNLSSKLLLGDDY